MKKAVVVLCLLIVCTPAEAKESKVCKNVGSQCIGVILNKDGEFWFADRVIDDRKAAWVPIRKTDCPSVTDKHGLEFHSSDKVYGRYTCYYDSIEPAPPAETRGYFRSHLELLLADTLVILSQSADAASTVHCQKVSRGCIETSSLAGRHPNELRVWGVATLFMTTGVTVNHLLWFLRPEDRPDLRHIIWVTSIPLTVTAAYDTWNNSLASELLQRQAEARARLAQ